MTNIPDLKLLNFSSTNDTPGLYDIKLLSAEDLSEFDTVEVDIMLYPNSRTIKSSNYTVEPFEEYLENESIRYKQMIDTYAVAFALFVGLSTTTLLGYSHANELGQYISFEEIAAGLGLSYGAYIVWKDVEKLLIERTKNSPLKFKEQYFTHKLHDEDIFVHEREFARKQRFGSERILPKYMSFHQSSNSTIVRMKFTGDQFSGIPGNASIGSVRFDENLIKEVEEKGFQLGVHFKLGTKDTWHDKKIELRQLLSEGKPGIINSSGTFVPNHIDYRLTQSYLGGRRKRYLKQETIQGILLQGNITTS